MKLPWLPHARPQQTGGSFTEHPQAQMPITPNPPPSPLPLLHLNLNKLSVDNLITPLIQSKEQLMESNVIFFNGLYTRTNKVATRHVKGIGNKIVQLQDIQGRFGYAEELYQPL